MRTSPGSARPALQLIVARGVVEPPEEAVDVLRQRQQDARATEPIATDVMPSIERIDFDGWLDKWIRGLANSLGVDSPRAS